MSAKSQYRIKRDVLEDGQEMFDVYILSEGVWEIVESFQLRENAEKYIENAKREDAQ